MSIRRIIDIVPRPLRAALYRALLAVKHPKLISAAADYRFTDEKLKFVHILECMNYLKVAGADESIPHVYFEFGCHSGRTFSAAVNAARFVGLNSAQFYAFDSFEGLPATVKEEDGYFESGTFATSRRDFVEIVERNTGLRLADHNITEGYYSNSLTSELQAKVPNVGVLHIDVDLYSSTKELLAFVKPLLVVGTVLVFDDWYCFAPGANQGEKRALQEFCEENPLFAIEEWKAYSTFGKSFFVTRLP